MKKISLSVVLLMAVLFCSANVMRVCDFIDFEYELVDPTNEVPDHRGPVLVPEVSIEGYTLFFGTPCDGSVLRLLDEDGYVVYSTVIPTGTTTLPLPTTLSGDYELQIIRDGWCFYGWIEL